VKPARSIIHECCMCEVSPEVTIALRRFERAKEAMTSADRFTPLSVSGTKANMERRDKNSLHLRNCLSLH